MALFILMPPSIKQPSHPSYACAVRHGVLFGSNQRLSQSLKQQSLSHPSQTFSSGGSCGSSPGLAHQLEQIYSVSQSFGCIHKLGGWICPRLPLAPNTPLQPSAFGVLPIASRQCSLGLKIGTVSVKNAFAQARIFSGHKSRNHLSLKANTSEDEPLWKMILYEFLLRGICGRWVMMGTTQKTSCDAPTTHN